MSHEDRNVPENSNSTIIAIALQGRPLPKKLKLDELVRPQHCGIRGKARPPVGPGNSLIGILQSHEPRKAFQPPLLFRAKGLKVGVLSLGRLAEKSSRSLAVEFPLEGI